MIQMKDIYRPLAAVLTLAGASLTASAETIFAPAGGDIRKAINLVSNGDVIQLEAGWLHIDSLIGVDE